MIPQFVIYVQNREGEILRAFTWTRDARSGIERAKREENLYGQVPVEVWAAPVKVACV
jgi:hypothetical protein